MSNTLSECGYAIAPLDDDGEIMTPPDLAAVIAGVWRETGVETIKVTDPPFNAGDLDETGTCAECRLDPPDGCERSLHLEDGGVLWLHPACESAYVSRRLKEEGIVTAMAGPPPDPPSRGSGETRLTPCRDALVLFVESMFKNADPRGYVSLRAFRDDKRDDKPIFIDPIRLDDPALAAVLLERARQAANWDKPAVFCPPVATFQNAKNAKTNNLLEGPDLSAECDQNPLAARSTLEEMLGSATIVVESGGEWINPETGEVEPKVHLHWRLKKPTSTTADHERLREARALATNLVGGDASNKSVVHPIRWPGSWHRKQAPRLAKIVASSDKEIDLDEALEILREATGSRDLASAGAASAGRGAPLDFDVFGFPRTGKLRAPDDAAVTSALSVIPNNSELKDENGNLAHDWNYWNDMGMKTWAATGGSEFGRAAFHTWSAKANKYDKAETDDRWDHYKTSPPTKAGFGSLVYLARQHAPGWAYPPTPDGSGEAGATGAANAGSGAIDPVDLWAKFEPPSLPRGLLPPVIEDFAVDRATAQGSDISGFAITALAVCAGAISDEIKLQPKKNDTEWVEAPRFWALLIGDPSTLKSPIFKSTTKPLQRIDHAMANDYQNAYAEWLKLSKEDKRVTDAPKKLRAMIYDATIEATQEILRDSPAGVLLENDELSGWFDSMYKYSGNRGAQTDRSFWLKAYDGGAKTVDRIGRGMVLIPNLSVSIAGASQPGPIRAIANMGEDDGLLQRFNPLMLRPGLGGKDEPPGFAVSEYNDLVKRLRGLRPPRSGNLYPSHAVLKFDDGAIKIREELERKHLDLMQTDWLNRKLASHFGKYNGMFARLCLIWHCIEHAFDHELPAVITENTARRVANFLHGFLKRHAFAFYTSVLGLSNDHDRLSNIADYILAHGLERVTNRDVQRGDQTMRDLERHETTRIFEQLEALGWVDIVPSPRVGYPPHWVVNPLVHERFKERAAASKERRTRGREIAREISASIKSNEAATGE